MDKKIAYLFIALGASLWGIIGLFVTYLYGLGFTPVQVVAIRALSATFFLVLYTLMKNRKLLKIKLADSKYFVGTGIISIVFFNWCLFTAIEETSISIAAILLYTAPAFVTVLSRLLFQEKLTARKLFALFTTLTGCALVIGVFPIGGETITLYGFLLGIGSGFFYALYSIFGKFALRKYDSLTVAVYTFVFAAIAVAPFSGLSSFVPLFLHGKVWFYVLGLGFLSTMLAYILYTKGLTYVETSRASIIATVEPVVASLISFLVFNEKLVFWQYIGIVLVITAVVLVQEPAKARKKKKTVSQESSL
ncbi:DMT family transporter [Pseudalkalibacillus caeni]|uniref:EamA family transporter n=1 Tax=Exobacillus caeni TaxID=2574798 RepID=A0A5R9F0P0_9BACL|nr:EamA family transporter [Pseudalkalibacillus caeni]TLS37117.1 EamA family transporter [Pseudalkalibacillus caeni]